jgi:hypothetical protein
MEKGAVFFMKKYRLNGAHWMQMVVKKREKLSFSKPISSPAFCCAEQFIIV